MGITYTLHFFLNTKAKEEKRPFKGPPSLIVPEFFRLTITNKLLSTMVIMQINLEGGTTPPMAHGLLLIKNEISSDVDLI